MAVLGFESGAVADSSPINEALPVVEEATWREGGDGDAFETPFPRLHTERVMGGGEADVVAGFEADGDKQILATLRRTKAYGVILLDSFQEDTAFDQIGPEGFFLGRKGGNDILEFGISAIDDVTRVVGEIETNQVAPVGVGGEAEFAGLWLVLEYDTTIEVTVIPVVDGTPYESKTFTASADTPTREKHLVEITQAFERAGTEVTRQGVRGTWFQARIVVKEPFSLGGLISLEGLNLEYEVVSESLPELTYDPTPVQTPGSQVVSRFLMGQAGGNSLAAFGGARDDLGTTIEALAHSNAVAPAGEAGECIFPTLYLGVTRANPSDYDLQVVLIVDGERLTPHTVALAGTDEPTTELYEIALEEAFERGGTEVSRHAPRGTWAEVEVTSVGPLPDGDVVLEGFGLEYEPVREGQAAESG